MSKSVPTIASVENTSKIVVRERLKRAERGTLRTAPWKSAPSKGMSKSLLIKSALCTLMETSQERDEREYANGPIERELAERTARRLAEELLEPEHAAEHAEQERADERRPM